KTLGGCSSINGMIYMRGQSRDYDQWAQLTGDDSWRWDNVLPHFRRHEDHWRLDQPEGVNENFKRLHGNKATGSTGEWRVEKQ
ncbi:GMC family oxidoreductase N-terminal domain-containing protein, partial [Acinetobacter baumannii]